MYHARSLYGCAALMCGLGAIAGEPRGLHTSPIAAKGHRSAILAAAANSLATLLRYIVASLWHRTLCFSPRPTICWVLLFVSAVVPAGMCSVSRRFGGVSAYLAASCGTALATRFGFVPRISFRGLVLLLYCMCFWVMLLWVMLPLTRQ